MKLIDGNELGVDLMCDECGNETRIVIEVGYGMNVAELCRECLHAGHRLATGARDAVKAEGDTRKRPRRLKGFKTGLAGIG